MQGIREYKIVTGVLVSPKFSRQEMLEDAVRKAIGEGWQPVGGAFVVSTFEAAGSVILLGQALVK